MLQTLHSDSRAVAKDAAMTESMAVYWGTRRATGTVRRAAPPHGSRRHY